MLARRAAPDIVQHGEQRVIALAEMQDGSFRAGAMQVEVTISACGDD